MNNRRENTIEQWVTDYEGNKEAYDGWKDEVVKIIKRAIRASDIEVVSISARTKDANSLSDKITRKANKYKDPLKEVTDLVGVRIVTYFRKDIKVVCDAIGESLSVSASESVDKEKLLNRDQFGYAARHLIVSLPAYRKVLTENESFQDFFAEVQVRTALQDTWASIEHKLQYKGVQSLSDEASRSFYRLSAVLELADVEFERIRVSSESDTKELGSINDGDLSGELTLQSLDWYLLSTGVEDAYKSAASENGLVLEIGKGRTRELEKILLVASKLGLDTIGGLDSFLNTNITDNVELVKRTCDRIDVDPQFTSVELMSLVLVALCPDPMLTGADIIETGFLASFVENLFVK